MKWPQHKTPDPKERQGRAPYNFVPLPEAILEWTPFPDKDRGRGHDRLEADRHHGHIDLTITTETELSTRCAYPPEHEGKDGDDGKKVRETPDRQRFFHHGEIGKPVIPGSSLRGMVRSLVEILSYSRISRRPPDGGGGKARMRDRKLVYRAVADQQTSVGKSYSQRFLNQRGGPMSVDYPHPNVRAGYLESSDGRGWRIRPAEVHPCPPASDGSGFIRVRLEKIPDQLACGPTKPGRGAPPSAILARDVWVAPAPIKSRKNKGLTLWYAETDVIKETSAAGLVPGKLVCTGDTPKRTMHTVVYAPDPGAAPLPIPPAVWALYEEDRDMKRGLPSRPIKNAGDPLFYLVDSAGKLVFLGPTPFFRVPYTKSTGDFVPPATMGDETAPLDLAEAVFGTVNGERQKEKNATGAHRGRVFFEDAQWDGAGGAPFLEGEKRYPSILSGPKPTSYQNYLVQTDPRGERGKLFSYDSKTPEETVLRGFKQYWHRGSAEQDLHREIPEGDPSKGGSPKEAKETQYTAIRPVRNGVSFVGRVRFENLDDIELGALLAALDLPPSCRHKLGMGKPLGMGSVKIGAELKLVNPKDRYRSLAATGIVEPAATKGLREKAAKAFADQVLKHYTAHVAKPKVSTGIVWDIPRLNELRTMLEWDNKPQRSATAYLPDPKLFKDRQTLPTPSAVVGRDDPAVVAEVPGGGLAPTPQASTASDAVSAAVAATRETKAGAIVRFSEAKVRLRLDGEPEERRVPLDTRIFHTETWGLLRPANLSPGRRIVVELAGDKVVRVEPA